jgi:signal transduction histidine kinase
LPLLISGLMLVLIGAFLVITFREVTRLQLQRAGTRAQFAADQLAEQMALGSPQRLGDAQRLLDRQDLGECLEGQAPAACEAFSAAIKSAAATANLVIEVWTSDARRLASIAGASVGPALADGEPPSRAKLGVGPLRRSGQVLYSEAILEIPARQESNTSGFLVIRRKLLAAPNRVLLKQLVGDGAAIKLGNQIGDVWTDLERAVDAPRIDLSRPGIAHYEASDRRAYVGALSHIRGTPWAVWVEFPEAATLAESRAFLRRMSAIGLGILVVASALVWVMSGRVTKPLSKLTEQAEAIASGDYTRSVESTRGDEVGRLTAASNEMARRIRDAHDELEQRVAERTADLAAANEELESFSYSVSHDLRAPLRHIGGFAALLDKSASERLQETDRRYLKTIIDSASRMGLLIDDLLAFSRTGRSPIVKSTVKLQALVEDVQREVSAAAGGSIAWTVHPLPEVEADPSMLRQVLLNLLSNAVKYTSGRPDAEVEIGATQSEDGELTVYVRDNGVGFDMQYVHKLFGVFQRLHRAEEFEGTGIGLANVRRIVHRHGGRVWAEGELNRGATFYFSLPNRARADA